jgi:nucleoside 2-deoxyribosyltransferase
VRVYLAGPINGATDAEVFDWREQVKSNHLDTEFVDPTSRDYRGHEDENVEDIVEQDKADLYSCHAVIAWCPRPSVGTSMEVLYAWTVGMPVVVAVPDGAPVSPWLRYHSSAVVDSLEAALEVLRESIDT